MVRSASKSDKEEKSSIKINAERNYRYKGTVRVPPYYTWPEGTLKKHEVIKRVLVRWNYCMKWPDDSTSPKELLQRREELRNDKHQMELPGFPGIFICIHGGDIGMISDTRDMSKAPTVNNLLKYNCIQLKNLWITALKEQMKALEAAEGPNAITMPYLKHELSMAQQFDAEKEEKESKKYKDIPFAYTVSCKQSIHKTSFSFSSARMQHQQRQSNPSRRRDSSLSCKQRILCISFHNQLLQQSSHEHLEKEL